jgi:hypothetical protein
MKEMPYVPSRGKRKAIVQSGKEAKSSFLFFYGWK